MKTFLRAIKNKQNSISNVIIILLFAYSFLILGEAYFQELDLRDWIWNRHQNLFSWYSRPLFIIPACYYAYKHKLGHTAAWMVLMFTSLFWFAAPEQVSTGVQAYLDWEKQLFFTGESTIPLILLTIGVLIFLFGIFYAFYKRNMWYGLIIINIGTILKIFVSLNWGGETGLTAVIPSLSSLLFINTVAWIIWKRKRL